MILDEMDITFEALHDGTRYEILGIDDHVFNNAHCLLTISNPTTGRTEQFDFWNSAAEPYDTSQDTIEFALECVADDALNALWDEWEILEESDYDPQSIRQAKLVSAESLAKLYRLGWEEQDILDVANMNRGFQA